MQSNKVIVKGKMVQKKRQRWTGAEEEKFVKYEKLYYQGKVTIKQICEQFPNKTKSQVFSHIHKKKYRTKKHFGIFRSESKQEELRNLIEKVKSLPKEKTPQEFIQFYDKLKNKSILISKEILKELIDFNFYDDNSTVVINESILKTISLKIFYRKIMQSYIDKDKRNNEMNSLNPFDLANQPSNLFNANYFDAQTPTKLNLNKNYSDEWVTKNYFYIQELQMSQIDISSNYFEDLISKEEHNAKGSYDSHSS